MERLGQSQNDYRFLRAAWWIQFLQVGLNNIELAGNQKSWECYPTFENFCLYCTKQQRPVLGHLRFKLNSHGIPCVEHPHEDDEGTAKVCIQFLDGGELKYQFKDRDGEVIMSVLMDVEDWFEFFRGQE